jgi:Tol biopolymer transport system component
MRDTTLVAQPFSPQTGILEGKAVPVAEQVLVDSSTWRAAFAATDSGMLAYVAGGTATQQLRWYDRSGKDVGIAANKLYNLNRVRISPDGRRIAGEAGESLTDIWIYDVQRNVSTRFTFGLGVSSAPLWSPDGKWIAYGTVLNQHLNLYRKAANGMGQEELLLEGNDKRVQNTPNDWSPDGKSLIFAVGDLVGSAQLWELPLTGDHPEPKPVVTSGSVAEEARYSPDGHWIAYASNESGRSEVYVIPSNGSGGKWPISSGGGEQPVWRRDGKEIFYLTDDNKLMSVPISLKSDSVEVGVGQPLFPLANTIAGNVNSLRRHP